MNEPAPKKYPSGASKRRKRYEAVEAIITPAGEDTGEWSHAFKRAGKPDLANPGTDLSWVRKLQLIVMQQMATTPFPTLAQQTCWRRIGDMSKVVGLTSKRAELEATVKRLQKEIEGRRPEGAVEWATKVQRPSTARGGMTGPRAVPTDSPTDSK